MIGLVGVFTLYFYVVNRQQARDLKVIEGMVSLLGKESSCKSTLTNSLT